MAAFAGDTIANAYCILGVDPGSNVTGFGLVRGTGDDVQYVFSGTVAAGRAASRHERLREIFTGIARIIAQYQPTHFAIEDVFYSKNPRSALVLGEARGAAILAAAMAGLQRDGITGKAVTPYLLAHFHEATAGASLAANVRIILRNAELGARIAVAAASRP